MSLDRVVRRSRVSCHPMRIVAAQLSSLAMCEDAVKLSLSIPYLEQSANQLTRCHNSSRSLFQLDLDGLRVCEITLCFCERGGSHCFRGQCALCIYHRFWCILFIYAFHFLAHSLAHCGFLHGCRSRRDRTPSLTLPICTWPSSVDIFSCQSMPA